MLKIQQMVFAVVLSGVSLPLSYAQEAVGPEAAVPPAQAGELVQDSAMVSESPGWWPSGKGVCTGEWSYKLYSECESPNHGVELYNEQTDGAVCGFDKVEGPECPVVKYQACRHISHGIDPVASESTTWTNWIGLGVFCDGNCEDTRPRCLGDVTSRQDFWIKALSLPAGTVLEFGLGEEYKARTKPRQVGDKVAGRVVNGKKEVMCQFKIITPVYAEKESAACPVAQRAQCVDVPRTCRNAAFGVAKYKTSRSADCPIDPEILIFEGTKVNSNTVLGRLGVVPNSLSCSSCERLDLDINEITNPGRFNTRLVCLNQQIQNGVNGAFSLDQIQTMVEAMGKVLGEGLIQKLVDPSIATESRTTIDFVDQMILEEQNQLKKRSK